MEAMDGPINFGERDSWWGLLVDGFYKPIYKMTYNPPYYQALFEAYGFQTYFEQYCFNVDTKLKFNPLFYERAARAAERGGYSARHIKKSELEQYARDFTSIYNRAWVSHGGMKSLTEEQVIKTFKSMKPVMDEEIVWFTYHNDEPVAFWVNLPELNQLFKYCKGKFGWWQKLVFFYHKLMGHCNKFTGIAFGIVPEHQGKGLESFMILSAERVIRKTGVSKYDEFELQWIADFHPKMLRIPKSVGATQSRMLITYRYLFDRNKPFERHPTL
jgi:GNAT superfamily N-acetyltransferase